MAKIRIDLTEPILDGMDIKFKAPCPCTAVEGINVYYPKDDGSTGVQSFVFKDSHGSTLTGLGNLFAKDAIVKVMVDCTASAAYILNAATNSYLENNIRSVSSPLPVGKITSRSSRMIDLL